MYVEMDPKLFQYFSKCQWCQVCSLKFAYFISKNGRGVDLLKSSSNKKRTRAELEEFKKEED